MQMTTHQPPGGPDTPLPKAILDLLVINASNLVYTDERIKIFRRIQNLVKNTVRTANRRGLWLLVMTHSSQERDLAYHMTETMTGWCQGVRAVEEQDSETTARAALAFHQLHFPDVSEAERSSRILILGSTREVVLSTRCNEGRP
ncbi:hypothetical protein KDA_75730 [Dictyobacter alpinus]|uniref:Uncharacterized protein n=1 Tax=Dictyobacter alpinus TaxID=2014873 RepID=A0A402BL87_9CHLR|nr:hypothetical protein [Dictyobacter alpinus]GCE32089.1 hypothetical protein KDA_75730 [Dictyobacter alpinus]